MEKMNRWGQSINILAMMAIATTGMSVPAIASPEMATAQGSVQLAQVGSLLGQCRAAKQQIPVFSAADATSAAVRLLSANEQVTLADSSVDINGFIGISAPVRGYVQAVNLKLCTGGPIVNPNPPTSTGLCRRVARPLQGLAIRQQPSATSAFVGGVPYLGQVTLTANPPTVRRAENRDWVEISAPARGWVSKGLVTETLSNLVYCQ